LQHDEHIITNLSRTTANSKSGFEIDN